MHGLMKTGIFGFSLLFLTILSLGAQPALPELKQEVWVRIAFEEIDAASPVVGEATFPVPLAKKLIAAIPPKTIKESKEDGFDIPKIAQTVETMEVGGVYKQQSKDYHLKIQKILLPTPKNVTANYLCITTAKFPLKVPLSITSMTVKLLQVAFKDLQGMDAQLAAVIGEVKKTPPAVLLKGEDKLMDSMLEISLE